jgi:hypothetical protein
LAIQVVPPSTDCSNEIGADEGAGKLDAAAAGLAGRADQSGGASVRTGGNEAAGKLEALDGRG